MNSQLKNLIFGLAAGTVVAFSGMSHASNITGAGATFPYPLYAKWAEAYHSKTGVAMNYQSIGSGGGIKQIQAQTVDFGATDAPLTPESLNKSGLVQFPAVMGGVVPVINLPGVPNGQLKLSGKVLADIFMGKIKKWNDPKIAAENKGLKLPKKSIFTVHRADGSGTTFIFTNYLSKTSPAWKNKIGVGKAISWKGGMGGKGNEGVASFVQRTKGSIGYVEYAYALQNKMSVVQMKNHDGIFIKATDDSFIAAAANAKWDADKGFYEILTNQPGKDSWPITGATFILMQKTQANAAIGKSVLEFFDWAFINGDKMASDLAYVPLPEKVTTKIRSAWKKQIKDTKGKAIWK
ncbi:MAG: phosphate ABC transporter substrate-binding protein PstS [Gallionella sp.]